MADAAGSDPWRPFLEAIAALPPRQQAARLIGLSRAMTAKGDKNQAGFQALRALRLAQDLGDAALTVEARIALVAVVPGYHAHVATDPVRLAAWEAAFAAVVRPGMRALEIGAGCGILAMLAARAGARVVACERDLAMAAIADQVVALNGLRDRVRIVPKPVADLTAPGDLDAPTDLMFLDLFGDTLFDFQPFRRVREAAPLLAPGAVILPARVSLQGALACLPSLRSLRPNWTAGFDLSPLAAAAPMAETLGPGAADCLRGPAAPLVEATLPNDMPADDGEAIRTLVSDGGEVNGVALWLRLDLAEGCILEARPGAQDGRFYAKGRFFPFEEALETQPGDRVTVRLAWKGSRLSVGQVGEG